MNTSKAPLSAGEVPTSAGWYPYPTTGGTRYWDGERWTCDHRPPRKSFAADSRRRSEIPLVLMGGVGFSIVWVGAAFEEGSDNPPAYLAAAIVVFVLTVGYSVYLSRGAGPTTASVRSRIAQEKQAAKKKRRSANIASVVDSVLNRGRSRPLAPPSAGTKPESDPISRLASGEITSSLEKLHHLLYSGAITQEEYDATRARLLESGRSHDPFEQIALLSELHRDGVLGDVEFAAAKARLLGIS